MPAEHSPQHDVTFDACVGPVQPDVRRSMKFLPAQVAYFLQNREARRNIRLLWRFIFILLAMIAAYSILFHFLMRYEGKDHSWMTGVYWTLTVMTTLGFGDITFASDLGRVFSLLV